MTTSYLWGNGVLLHIVGLDWSTNAEDERYSGSRKHPEKQTNKKKREERHKPKGIPPRPTGATENEIASMVSLREQSKPCLCKREQTFSPSKF